MAMPPQPPLDLAPEILDAAHEIRMATERLSEAENAFAAAADHEREAIRNGLDAGIAAQDLMAIAQMTDPMGRHTHQVIVAQIRSEIARAVRVLAERGRRNGR